MQPDMTTLRAASLARACSLSDCAVLCSLDQHRLFGRRDRLRLELDEL